jgi:branched-chain amino acid transport system permease protein
MWKIREASPAHWAIRAVGAVVVVLIVLYVPTKTSTSTISDFARAFELIIAAMSLNLLFGYAGQISIGHSAFYGVGAYTSAILIKDHGWAPGWTFYVGAMIAFVVGMLISLPALRLRGIYLALVTLSVATLFPLLAKWSKLSWLTNGARGIDGVKYKKIPTWPILGELKGRDGRAVFAYWLAFVVLIVCYLICRGIVKSRAGRSLIAVRDNETAAAVMGINVAVTKGLVFGISAAMCAVAGSLGAVRSTTVLPDETNLTLVGSIIFLIVMVVGGASTLWGPVIGGVGYVLLDSYLREAGAKDDGVIPAVFGWFNGSPASLITAAVLIGFMFVAPFGLVGLAKKIFRKLVVVIPRPAGTGAPVEVA